MTPRSAPHISRRPQLARAIAALALGVLGMLASAAASADPYDSMLGGGLFFPSERGLPNTPEFEGMLGTRIKGGALGFGPGLNVRHVSSTDLDIELHDPGSGALLGHRLEYSANIDMVRAKLGGYYVWGDELRAVLAGGSGSYEVWFVQTGGAPNDRFGGWGGSVFVGFRVPLGLPLGLQLERFVGRVYRDGYDQALQASVREKITTSGWTLRLTMWVTE